MGQKGFLTEANIQIGKVGAPYGVKGWVHIHSFTDPLGDILNYQTWYLRNNVELLPVLVLQARPHGKSFVALLKDYSTREAVAKLTNREIYVPHSELAPLAEDEYYWADLVGLKVITETDVVLGIVVGLLETGSNDVLVVQGETKEHLVPYLPGDYVLKVDLALGLIRVSWDPEF